MNIAEQYADGLITFHEATEKCYRERSQLLHWGSSYRHPDRDTTFEKRARFIFEAGQWQEELIRCFAIMWEETTPKPLWQLGDGKILHAIVGTDYGYRTPTDCDSGQILHKPLTPHQKLARENFAYQRLDEIIVELEKLGYKEWGHK